MAQSVRQLSPDKDRTHIEQKAHPSPASKGRVDKHGYGTASKRNKKSQKALDFQPAF